MVDHGTDVPLHIGPVASVQLRGLPVDLLGDRAQAAGALEAEADGCDSEGKPSILLCDPRLLNVLCRMSFINKTSLLVGN